MARTRKARKANIPDNFNQRMLDMVQRATTQNQRLAALTVCFLTGQFPMHFRYRMEAWGRGPTLHRLLTADMENVKHTCNTVGCIAGLANFLFMPCKTLDQLGGLQATNLLGINLQQKSKLFTPDAPLGEFVIGNIQDNGDAFYTHLSKNPVEVGRVLVNFLRTNNIDWSAKVRTKPVRVAGRWF